MDENKLSQAIIALSGLVERLRGRNGCPWDAQQTDSTIKMYLIEEAYEVLDAIEDGPPKEVCGELGDLLFQIVFLSRLAEDGELSAYKHDTFWYAMDTLRDRNVLDDMWNRGEAPWKIWD